VSAHGQLDFEGREVTDDRVEQAAKAMYWRDVKRRHRVDNNEAGEIAKAAWPKVRQHYVETATVALKAAGVL
jgi:hypothetical protein